MSKLSSQFAAISPGMTVEESTESLVSSMKATIKFCLVAQEYVTGLQLIAGNV